MNMTDDKPIVLSKRKNVQVIIDYCLEQKISFSANPRAISIDEWEVELNITSIKAAIALGMFVRENKLEMYGMGETTKTKPTTSTTNGKKTETKEAPINNLIDLAPASPAVEETTPVAPTLTFDLNTSNN
jgi:hypothetical protein